MDDQLWTDTPDGLGRNIQAFRSQIETAGIDPGLAAMIGGYADDAAMAYSEGDYEAARKALKDGRRELQRVTPRLAIPASVGSTPRPVAGNPTGIKFTPRRTLPSTRQRFWGIVVIVAMFAATFVVLAVDRNAAPAATANGPTMAAGSQAADSPLADQPAGDSDPGIFVTQARLMQMAGLPSTYSFVTTDVSGEVPLGDLGPGQVGWADSLDYSQWKGHQTILADDVLYGPDPAIGFGPGNGNELLIANTGHGLRAIYFPSCAGGGHLGSGPPSGTTRPLISFKTVTGVCS